MTPERGFAEDERPRVAALYWGAFGGKLGRLMGPRRRALAFLQDVMDPTHALTMRDAAGRIQGLVGFKTYRGAFVGGHMSDMVRHYGRLGGPLRAGLLSLLEREVENHRFVMDGIIVAPEARGQGIGTALLEAIAQEAADRGFSELRLDVIDSNPRARALYERRGFVVGGEHRLGLLRHVFGFRCATTMIRRVG
ncbi:GNAT family N-acetyltransferase [Salibaculum halophilum]|uniref:GNAT family N-acetyltransferase n=1 Tax=Salibaculum halophilum TaxID=1914408 RepID=UPI000A1071BC|nr:GNAT family N-acetyltransferase [Salibaculum halophilum]